MRLFSQSRGSLRARGSFTSFLTSPFLHRLSKHCFLVQAEGAGADQAGVGAAAGGGEAGEEGRGAGEDDPG